MLDKLEEIARRHAEFVEQQADPAVAVDPKRSREVAKRVAELEPVVTAYRAYRRLERELEGARELASHGDDAEMQALAAAEAEALAASLDEVEQRIKVLLLPEDPNDRRNVIIEIRAGTGGEEAALFAGDLLRMYGRYAEIRGWRFDITTSARAALGGFKEVGRRGRGRPGVSAASSTRAACTGCSGCRRPRPRAGSTPRPPPWP